MDRASYYERVKPLLGDTLARARLLVWDLRTGYLPAEALARSGLLHQVWLDEGEAQGAFCRSLGWHHRGIERSRALEAEIRDHNRWEPGFEIEAHGRTSTRLRDRLSHVVPDLILARADADAEAVARLALERGVSLLLTSTPASSVADSLVLVWTPGCQVPAEQVLSTARWLGSLPALDPDVPRHHVQGLEAGSLSLSLARWLLGRPGLRRPDLDQPIVEEGRILLARGEPAWPWSTRFLRPTPEVLALLSRPVPRWFPTLELLRGERLLVLGLGTASLFCAEASLLSPHLCLLDAKEVSPFNPVRQVYGTDDIGRPKPEALAAILRRRVAPGDGWTVHDDGPLKVWARAWCSISEGTLHLREDDDDSRACFEAILDRFRPTLAVVGMGRGKDDNFTATTILRRRGIRHITPSAFPAVTHYKHVLTDGERGPCYDCIQGHLPLDGGAGPTLADPIRELYYGGTQPATLAETLPSAHSLLRLAIGLALPRPARPAFLTAELDAERVCFVGANLAERGPGGWLYGVDRPFAMVTYGVSDLVGSGKDRRCACGRLNNAPLC